MEFYDIGMTDMELMMIDRGMSLFESKIDRELQSLDDENIISKLAWLKNHFKNRVVVAEIKNSERLAAARAANACIEVAKSFDGTQNEDMEKEVLICYFESPIGHVTPREKTTEQNTLNVELFAEIDKHRPTLSTGTCGEDRFDCEMIDLINSVGVEDLTIEGKRARGFLPADFDSSVDNEDDYETSPDALPTANVEVDKYGTVVAIYCPNPDCNSSEIVIEMSKGYCPNCDMEFEVPLRIDVEEYEEMGYVGKEENKNIIILENDEKFQRITGQKKDRGIIGLD